ncbi:hypothetical protein CLAUR_028400 [Clostridium felsineum]|nr:hypothetical protein CLAUR_028400 [Clostridium felsineum]
MRNILKEIKINKIIILITHDKNILDIADEIIKIESAINL